MCFVEVPGVSVLPPSVAPPPSQGWVHLGRQCSSPDLSSRRFSVPTFFVARPSDEPPPGVPGVVCASQPRSELEMRWRFCTGGCARVPLGRGYCSADSCLR